MDSVLIEQSLAALRDGDSATARKRLEQALAEGEAAGDVLAALAAALYLEREYLASAANYERAYGIFRSEGNQMAAVRGGRWSEMPATTKTSSRPRGSPTPSGMPSCA
jgi:hypothetical protein